MPIRTSLRLAQVSSLARWNARWIGLWRIAPSSVFLTTTSSTGAPASGIFGEPSASRKLLNASLAS